MIRISDKSDLALVKIERKATPYFKISENLPQIADKVFTIGNGNGFGLAYSEGNIAAVNRKVKYEDQHIEVLQLSLNINEGNSGGALVDQRGELIGITAFRLRDEKQNIIYGTSFALPVSTIKEFLI